MDITKLINKLNRETKEGKLVWGIASSQSIKYDGEYVINGNILKSFTNGRDIYLYKFKTKYYQDEIVFSWVDGIELQLVDPLTLASYIFPASAGLDNLYDSITYKLAKIDDFLNQYLEDEEDPDF